MRDIEDVHAMDMRPVSLDDVQRLAAFSDGDRGGNPAGVWIGDQLPSVDEMQRIARAVGYSETAFVAREPSWIAPPPPKGMLEGEWGSIGLRSQDRFASQKREGGHGMDTHPLPDPPLEGEGAGDRSSHWRVRYFSPEAEVPFCGHATIALGAALAMHDGDGVFALELNDVSITVEGRQDGPRWAATLTSPPTKSRAAAKQTVAAALTLFDLRADDLDLRIPPAEIHAGAGHLVLMLKNRATLAAMRYDFDHGRTMMREREWITIVLGHVDAPRRFVTRNPFAFGGVYEDPATGASAAALAGYLRDLGWPHEGAIEIHQGDDMGMPSRIHAAMTDEPGSAIRVSGGVRVL